MQGEENSQSPNAGFHRLDIPATPIHERSQFFDRGQSAERRQMSNIGSTEKIVAPNLMQTPEGVKILGKKPEKDMKVLDVNRGYDEPSTSGTIQHPESESNPGVIVASGVASGFDPKNIRKFNANQPKERYAKILLNRPGPSGIRHIQEVKRVKVMRPPTPIPSADALRQGPSGMRNMPEFQRVDVMRPPTPIPAADPARPGPSDMRNSLEFQRVNVMRPPTPIPSADALRPGHSGMRNIQDIQRVGVMRPPTPIPAAGAVIPGPSDMRNMHEFQRINVMRPPTPIPAADAVRPGLSGMLNMQEFQRVNVMRPPTPIPAADALRPGPSGMLHKQEFQRVDVIRPPTPIPAADAVSPGPADVLDAQGDPSRRSKRDIMDEILSLLGDYKHGIPEPLTQYYLENSGFNNFSPEIVKLVGVTAQKYIYDILCDALKNCKERMAREKAEQGESSEEQPLTLTQADLLPALKKYKEGKK